MERACETGARQTRQKPTMTRPIITEDTIRRNSTPETLRRGRDYYQHDAVGALTLRGQTLTGEVEGSAEEPYRVSCTLPTQVDGAIAATCSCPYDWGGWCKHIVAVLLTYSADPDDVAEKPPLERLLAALTREQLQATLLRLVALEPDLAEAIEHHTAAFVEVSADGAVATSTADVEPSAAQPRLNPEQLRRQIKTAIRGVSRGGRRSYDYYHHMDDIVEQFEPFIDQVEAFVETSDGRSAARALEVITEEFLTVWAPDEDENGAASSLFAVVGPLWTEALLSGDFTRDERKAWAKQLTAWSEQLEDYASANLASAVQAAQEGWDHPQLQRILRDELTDAERATVEAQLRASQLERHPWLARLGPDGRPNEPAPGMGPLRINQDAQGQITVRPYYMPSRGVDESDDGLTKARLRVLARRGRYDEYLAFARLMGEPLAYATMLAQRGQVEEAAAYGREHLRMAESALTLAQALLAQGAPTLAFAVAQHGLTAAGSTVALARWLRDSATAHPADEIAGAAALIAFQADVDLPSYQAVQRLAGADWPRQRERLLTIARQRHLHLGNGAGPIGIFLHEGLLDDAIAALGSPTARGYSSHDVTLDLVLDAALMQRPDWVIQTCRTLAEQIMASGSSGLYEDAARLLGKARNAYRAANRAEEWRVVLADVMTRYRRKYKLIPLLSALE